MNTKKTGIRLNTERGIAHENFKVKIGTTNREKPDVIYYNAKTYISPLDYKEDYTRDINIVKRYFQNRLYNFIELNKNFTNKNILDFNIGNTKINSNGKTLLTIETLIKQRGDSMLSLKNVKENSEKEFVNVLDDLTDNLYKYGFTVAKTKK